MKEEEGYEWKTLHNGATPQQWKIATLVLLADKYGIRVTGKTNYI